MRLGLCGSGARARLSRAGLALATAAAANLGGPAAAWAQIMPQSRWPLVQVSGDDLIHNPDGSSRLYPFQGGFFYARSDDVRMLRIDCGELTGIDERAWIDRLVRLGRAVQLSFGEYAVGNDLCEVLQLVDVNVCGDAVYARIVTGRYKGQQVWLSENDVGRGLVYQVPPRKPWWSRLWGRL